MVNFDNVLCRIGEFGRAQILLYFFIGLCGIPTGEQSLASVFTGASQRHWCRVDALRALSPERRREIAIPRRADTGDFSRCRRFGVDFGSVGNFSGNFSDTRLAQLLANASEVACDSWEFDTSEVESTVASQFNLVCSNAYVAKLITSVYMAGFLAGCTVSGIFSDKFGRILTVAVTSCGQVVAGLLAAVVPSLAGHMLLRCLVGFFTSGTFTTAFVIAMEIIGPKARMQTGIFVQGWFALGFILVAVLGFFIRNHVTLQILLAVQPAIFISYYWLYPESPRWLLSQGRHEEADRVCRRIAAMNRKELPEDFCVTEEAFGMGLPELEVNAKDLETPGKQQGNVFDLVRTPRMRLRSMNVFFTWFAVSLTYYGLSLNAEDIGGGIYFGTCVSGLVELPAYAISCVTLNRFGRVTMLAATLALGGIGCVSASFASLVWLKVTLAMVGKFAVSAAFAIVYVYSAEVFPTVIRNVGVGIASTHARIGSLLAPQIVLLSKIWQPLPFLLIGILSLAAALLSLLLPETLRQPLPETVADGENFGLGNVTPVQAEIDS